MKKESIQNSRHKASAPRGRDAVPPWRDPRPRTSGRNQSCPTHESRSNRATDRPAPTPPASPTKTSTAKLTPYAELLLARANTDTSTAPCTAPNADWISTAIAAKLTGYSQRNIQRLCDEGFFDEGKDWRQRPPRPGARHGGVIWLRRSALKKFDEA